MNLLSYIQVELYHHEGNLCFSSSTTGKTAIEVELGFNGTASPEEIPPACDVLKTMRLAAAATCSSDIAFDVDSIVVTGILNPFIKVTAIDFTVKTTTLSL